MAKHTAHDKMILVRHKPGYRRRRVIQVAFLVILCSFATYNLGIYEMSVRHQAALAKLDELSGGYRALQSDYQLAEQQIANLEQNAAINQRANQEIHTTIKALRENVAQLQKDVTFYQGIMAPSKNSKGLQIQTIELSALESNSRYAYKIVLAQVGSNRRYLEGVVAVNIVGKQDGEDQVIPLRDVSSVKELGMKFRFRYFQEFEGEILLPAEFQPEQLQVVAQSKGKSASRIERSSEWGQLVPTANVSQALSALDATTQP